MDARERQQLELIVSHELVVVRAAVPARLQTVFRQHSASGRLRSGATVTVSLRELTNLADSFLKDLTSKIGAVASDLEAFEILSAALEACLRSCEDQLTPILQMAGDIRPPGEESSPVERVARELFREMRSTLEAQLAISRYDFDRSSSARSLQAPVVAAIPAQPANKGGRPPAEFWDYMWAAIAAALYDGTLIPKRQADIERAMADWISGNGRQAVDSTVRARARRLWDRIAP